MDSPEYLTDSDSLKNKLNFFFELIGCSYNLAYWKYGEDGHMIISTSEDSRILDTLFSVGNIKAFMLNYGKNNDMPLIISSPLGNIWVIIVEHLPQFNNYHVMGPLFTNSISKSAIKERLEAFQIPISWKKDFEKLILSFPSIPWNQVIHYTIMFHYIVTGEK